MEAEAWFAITHAIGAATGRAFSIEACQAVGGGCINSAWTVGGKGARYFVKANEAAKLPMLESEAAGLEALAKSRVLRVPRPVCIGASGDVAWLVLEHVMLKPRDASTDARLGTGLARLHHESAPTFGWHRDNAIGSTPQFNPPSKDWPAFWRDARLTPQLDLAERNGHRGRLQTSGTALLERVKTFFEGYRPQPALLHGDLWSGNAAADAAGAPVIFDPAVYYGDREADIAMTELFGGFSPAFYRAYRDAYPLDAGYEMRRDLYNLYHVLNHLNLFGGGYPAQAQQMIDRLLSATR